MELGPISCMHRKEGHTPGCARDNFRDYPEHIGPIISLGSAELNRKGSGALAGDCGWDMAIQLVTVSGKKV